MKIRHLYHYFSMWWTHFGQNTVRALRIIESLDKNRLLRYCYDIEHDFSCIQWKCIPASVVDDVVDAFELGGHRFAESAEE